jgi:SAM-dependent methyltransferase
MTQSKLLTHCLCCGSENLELTLDLGQQPLANSFISTPTEFELTFPLVLNRCADCSHLQLSHAVDPNLLFKNYLYVSGTSQTLRDYFDWFAKEALVYCPNARSVLDIACNDGSQLNSFKALGLKTYGIDPAENLYSISSTNHEVICDYFNHEHVAHYVNRVDIITAQNVFAHNSYPLEFLEQCRDIMHKDSVLLIQTSQADMIKNNEFDTIYHEHLSFFCANSMNELSQRAGLNLIDIRKTPIHGNSYVFVFSRSQPAGDNVADILEEERQLGLQDSKTYQVYATKCQQVVKDLKETIEQYRSSGYVIAGYGAAAKGMTLLNFGNINLDFVIDDNPLKQGRYTPGTHDPVVGINVLDNYAESKIAFVPLAWNFFDEICQKIKNKRTCNNDVFIRYFPNIKVSR